jgi:hypothetical protein
MGNNYENIKELVSDILRWMREMEKMILNLHPERAKLLVEDSLLTDLDLEREEIKLLYAQKRKLL